LNNNFDVNNKYDISTQPRNNGHSNQHDMQTQPRNNGYPNQHDMPTPPRNNGYPNQHDMPTQARNNGHSNQHDMPTQARNNGYHNQHIDNRELNYHPPPSQPIQKRVQIVEHNRQIPSTDYISGKNSPSSSSPNNHSRESNQFQQRSPPRHHHIDEHKPDGTNTSIQRSNNFNIHDYLYGLSAPDPG
jgi:hypothetical protein